MLHIAPLRVPRLWIPMRLVWFVCLFVCLPRFSVELPVPSYLALSALSRRRNTRQRFMLLLAAVPLHWDRVQQKMGQAVNYHKRSGK